MAKGYGEMMALIEIGKQIAKAEKPEEKKPQRTEKKEKPPSWEQLWLEAQKKRDEYEAFMKVIKKQMAEDPKKEDKKPIMDVDKIALLLLAIVPLNWAAMYLLLH